MSMESLSHGTMLPNTNETLTIIIPHVKYGRSAEVDEILLRLGLYEHYLIAAAAHSVLYSDKRYGMLSEWNNDYFEYLWEYALPSSFYEYGSDFEKHVLVNERDIYSYARWLLLLYQNLMFSAMNEFSAYYNYIAQQGGCVFLGTKNSLNVFGYHKHEYFDRYCSGSISSLPIGKDSRITGATVYGPAQYPYYITRKSN